jgi:hypothetical protein
VRGRLWAASDPQNRWGLRRLGAPRLRPRRTALLGRMPRAEKRLGRRRDPRRRTSRSLSTSARRRTSRFPLRTRRRVWPYDDAWCRHDANSPVGGAIFSRRSSQRLLRLADIPARAGAGVRAGAFTRLGRWRWFSFCPGAAGAVRGRRSGARRGLAFGHAGRGNARARRRQIGSGTGARTALSSKEVDLSHSSPDNAERPAAEGYRT